MNPARGAKHTCQSCDARFYDLGRLPAVCPKCGTVQVEVVRPAPQQNRKRGMAKGPQPYDAAEDRDRAADEAADGEDREPSEEEELDDEAEPESESEDEDAEE